MKNIILKYSALLFLLLLLAGCNKGDGTISTDKDPKLVNISMGTKTNPSDNPRSYRFSLFTEEGATIAPQSGTYRDIKIVGESDWLIPCAVNDLTGEITNDAKNTAYGLFASVGTYTMTAVSPAIKAQKISIDTKEYWGYPISRVPEVNETKLFVGEPAEMTIAGILTNGEYNYTFPEGKHTLKEQRTRFELEAYSKTGIEYDIASIKFTNVINKGHYNPFVGYYVEKTADHLITLSPFENDGKIKVNWATAKEVAVKTGDQAVSGQHNIWMLSGNYDESDRYTIIPNLQIVFNSSGDTKTKEINIELNRHFKPQYTYTFTLILSSIDVKLEIKGSPNWETGGDSGLDDGNIDVLPSFKFSISDGSESWEDKDEDGNIYGEDGVIE